ncbi:hypothetical protein APUTEX25_004030, partial [Auxenochlorella protothecoides]
GPFTIADIVAAKATVHCTYYNKPLTQATIPTECVSDFLHGEGRMFRKSFHRQAHPATQVRIRSTSNGRPHTFTVKQLRQDSKKSIVFYPDIGHLAHSDAAFHWLRLSQWAVDLVESLPTINPAFRNPSIVASLKAFLLIAMGLGNRVHNGSAALLRHERVEGIQKWLRVIIDRMGQDWMPSCVFIDASAAEYSAISQAAKDVALETAKARVEAVLTDASVPPGLADHFRGQWVDKFPLSRLDKQLSHDKPDGA